jgi:hypothetical protein
MPLIKHGKSGIMNAMNQSSQSGNIFLWVLMAIVLLAAVGVAVMRTNPTSTNMLTDEQAKVYANQIIAYANNVQSAVKRLQLRGCADTEISFENSLDTNYINLSAPSDKSCHVFDPSGGGLNFFQNRNVILYDPYFMGIGAITGVGTAAGELIMYGEVDKATCIQINKILHGNTDEPIYDHIASVAYFNSPQKFKGGYAALGAIAETSSWRNGLSTACIFRDDYSGSSFPDAYQFYFTLIPR